MKPAFMPGFENSSVIFILRQSQGKYSANIQ